MLRAPNGKTRIERIAANVVARIAHANVVDAARIPGQNWLPSGGTDFGTIHGTRPRLPNMPLKKFGNEPSVAVHEYTTSAAKTAAVTLHPTIARVERCRRGSSAAVA